MNISIIILAKDEEVNLPRLLESIRWCDDVHLVDSGSHDGTISIVQATKVHVREHPFSSFGAQRNWALENCNLRHPWILFLDADEASTPEFEQGLRRAVQNAPERVAGFYCCWKMMLDGRWLQRSDSFPKWQLRLLRRGRARFKDFGHGQMEGDVDGDLDFLREPYLHFAFSKGWAAWLDRHNRYSTKEAIERLKSPVRWRDLISRNPSTRNKALKPLVSRIPGWPFMRFLAVYVFSLGFLEGAPGFIYAVNLGYYEFLIRLKMRELRRQRQNQDARHRLGN